ncbi:hypothetical protein [Roseovarius sp. A-2]|uniref:hypothetical protein n=1 Tax=Roseovarius sp. A-2 TaxID=1570360 RepID=UPI0009B5418E|nr:hypothetical protein [Roseovarius sp. A-2]
MSAHERLKWLARFKAGPDRVRIHAGGRVVMMWFEGHMVSYDRQTMKLAAGWVWVEELARAAGVQAVAVAALNSS